MSPSRAPIGRVEWTRWVAAMACRCGRSTHGDNDAPRSDVQGSTPPPRRLRGACESSQVFQLAACARPAAAASRARPDPDIRLWSGMVIRRESAPPERPGPARSATPRPANLPRSVGPAVLGGLLQERPTERTRTRRQASRGGRRDVNEDREPCRGPAFAGRPTRITYR